MASTPSAFEHRNLPLLLLQARERVLARFRPVFNAHGLTDQQWRVVRALHDRGPLEPREIGEICCISSPSMAGMLARMEDLGLVQRERLKHDQRRVRVSLTRKSKALAAQVAPLIEQTYRDIEDRLGRDFIEALYGELDRLLQVLEPMGTQGAEE